MAFTRETDITKDEIGDFEIVFFVPGASNTEGVQAGNLNAQIIMSDGSIENVSFNLLARLQDDAAGQQHAINLAALRDYAEARLIDEVLPTP